VNYPPLRISLSFWVDLVGACNSIWYQSRWWRRRSRGAALVEEAHSPWAPSVEPEKPAAVEESDGG
jgi:hypothetical protein